MRWKSDFRAIAGFARTLKVFQFAKSLVAKQGGDPRVVLAAALLLDLAVRGSPGASGPSNSDDGSANGIAEARALLKQSGLDDETLQRIDGILISYGLGQESDTLEFALCARLPKWLISKQTKVEPCFRCNTTCSGQPNWQ